MAEHAIIDHDAPTLAAKVNAGVLDARDVVDAFIKRIDTRNPAINAIVDFDPAAARAEAEGVRARLRAGERPALAGVPVVVKDTIWVRGRRITQGSLLFRDFRAPRDALAVARLRAAGAVIIGIGNAPEFGCKEITDNRIYGPTRHPMDLRLTPGGSSGGCAAALAADMAPLALGGDGGGSCRRPPAHVGVVGFKPTNGVIADPYGFDGLAPGIGVVGPMGRCVADLQALFEAIVGTDPHDALSLPLPAAPVQPATTLRVAYSPRIGLDVAVDPDVDAAMEAAIARLEAAGLPVGRADPPSPAGTHEGQIVAIEPSALAAQFGAAWRRDPTPFDSHVGAMIEAGLRLGGADVARAWGVSTKLAGCIAAFFDSWDLLLCPTLSCVAWPLDRLNPETIDGRPAPHRAHAVFTPLFNHARTPAISVPCGAGRDGLPVGLQVIGARLADRQVLAAAQWIETALGAAARPWRSATAA